MKLLSNLFKNKSILPTVAIADIALLLTLVVISSIYPEYAEAQNNRQPDPNVLINHTNEARQDNNLPELRYSQKLTDAAKAKVNHMIENDYFAHTSPDGISPWFWVEEEDYQYRHVGENLALGFRDSRATVDAWMDSPGHRRNILNSDFTEIGIAVMSERENGQGDVFIVQLFGTPQNPRPAIISSETVVESAPQLITLITNTVNKIVELVNNDNQIISPSEIKTRQEQLAVLRLQLQQLIVRLITQKN